MLWQVLVLAKPGQADTEGQRVQAVLSQRGFAATGPVRSAKGYLIEGRLDPGQVQLIADQLLCDPVVERAHIVAQPEPATSCDKSVASVLLKPGVMDPVALSCRRAIADLDLAADAVQTFRRYWFEGADSDRCRRQIERVLANEAIEQVTWGPLPLEALPQSSDYRFQLITLPVGRMSEAELQGLSRGRQLSLSLIELQAIRDYYRHQGRDATDAEIETLAQTWSEHCSHKTLRGQIDYRELDERGQVLRRHRFQNLLGETIAQATEQVRCRLGPDRDWCVSVFEDNAGIVRFDEQHDVCFKVETHNHPSAIEPYGGANTGVGGVIRDVIGTGLGARPIAGTDIFCFAPPDWPYELLPPGVLHPRRVMQGVVAGVRDYGNRMGIPTVNGAVYFDPRYLGNPLVYCGSIGLLPRRFSRKQARPNDLIVAVGGRTGRDGIHGATFSSAELTEQSEELSGGAVQIGNAITEKMMLDVLLAARDRGLYHAITDCGAGGFSSAVGEMGAHLGAEVWLEAAPLKYRGLSYTEIWISEAQERMVLAVPEDKWPELHRLCQAEGVEATVIGRFTPTGRLTLKYQQQVVADLEMQFLHNGRPQVVRQAHYTIARPGPLHAGHGTGTTCRLAEPPNNRARSEGESRCGQPSFLPESQAPRAADGPAVRPAPAGSDPPFNQSLRRILAAWNVCSKHWLIRQYDHEVQGASVVKPLVGPAGDGPSDAAVLCPVPGSHRGLVIACGANPCYGDLDTYWMAAAAIDEAVRNCVAVGAAPDRIALLDNFCWGNTDRPEQLGALVRAALACRDIATEYGTPFISGKDSLNNEFCVQQEAADGSAATEQRIVIPPTLLISALGQLDDVRGCVTMDLKEPGNSLYLVGRTARELGGSHYAMVHGLTGGRVPQVDAASARRTFSRLHRAIADGLVRSCHDLSEGGLAVALAEMAFAGRHGARCQLPLSRQELEHADADDPEQNPFLWRLFSESQSRFLVEVEPGREQPFERIMRGPSNAEGNLPVERIGQVVAEGTLTIRAIASGSPDRQRVLVQDSIESLRACWQRPLDW